MTITKMADIYENILICPFPFINMQGLWSGMLVGTLLQTVILVLITFRTKWQKEVILSQLYLCNLGPNEDNVLCMLVKISHTINISDTQFHIEHSILVNKQIKYHHLNRNEIQTISHRTSQLLPAKNILKKPQITACH